MATSCKECALCTNESKEIDKEKLIKRLNVIEGQVRGIKEMLKSNRYCDEILIQVSAVRNSLKSIGSELLESHLKTCVTKKILEGYSDALDDALRLFEKLN